MDEPSLRDQAIRYLVEEEQRMNEGGDQWDNAELQATFRNPRFRAWQLRMYPIAAAQVARQEAAEAEARVAAAQQALVGLGQRQAAAQQALANAQRAFAAQARGRRGPAPAQALANGWRAGRDVYQPRAGLGVAAGRIPLADFGRIPAPPPAARNPFADPARFPAALPAARNPLADFGLPGARNPLADFGRIPAPPPAGRIPARPPANPPAARDPDDLANVLALIAAAEAPNRPVPPPGAAGPRPREPEAPRQAAPAPRQPAPAPRQAAPAPRVVGPLRAEDFEAARPAAAAAAAAAGPARPFVRNALPIQALLEPPGERGYNWGMCPVCLLVIQEDISGSCLYHNHTCPVERRNQRLWNKYKVRMGHANIVGNCFTCGRATHEHVHYALQRGNARPRNAPIRAVGAWGIVDHWDCRASGGGNRREMIARVIGIIDAINNMRGAIHDDRAFYTALSDAAEEAAMTDATLAEADEALRNRRFPREIRADRRFGDDVAPLPAAANARRNAQIAQLQQENPDGVLEGIAAILMPEGQWHPVVAGAGRLGMGAIRGVGGVLAAGVGWMCARRGHRAVLAQINNGNIPAAPRVALAAGVCPPGHHVPERINSPHPDLHCHMCVVMGDDDDNRPLYRMHHDRLLPPPPPPPAVPPPPPPRDYIHPNEYLICAEHMVSAFLYRRGNMREDPDFGRFAFDCFQNQAAGCGGEIHPCEIHAALINDLTEAGDDADARAALLRTRTATYNRIMDAWNERERLNIGEQNGEGQNGGRRRNHKKTRKHVSKKIKRKTRKH